MARPRIFISSTFYDLKHVRADIERFLREMGYDPIANERGDIPYGVDEALEEYCYKEIDTTDILVSIIGGRYGSESQRSENSISQIELKTALRLGKQVYIFVDTDVQAEFRMYKINKGVDGVKYAHADSVKIFEFLEEIENLKRGNPTFGFKESSQIISILKEQLSGLFQRLLNSVSKQEEFRLVDSLKASTQSLQDVIKYLQSIGDKDSDVIKNILLPTHPIFSALAETIGVKYRVYFQNKEELDRFLKARNFDFDLLDLDDENYDWDKFRPIISKEGVRTGRRMQTLKISRSLFGENGDLKFVSPADWRSDWVSLVDVELPDSNDDTPF